MVAGRPISSTHEAHSSLRIMPTCAAIGEAAGTAAAMSIIKQITPGELDPDILRKKLLENKAIKF